MPTGIFRGEDGWAQVDYGTGTTIPIPDQGTRQTDTSPTSTNSLRKPNTGPRRTRRKMMPRGPEGEQRPM